MQEQALKIASHITHPMTIAAFALVFAAPAFALAIRAKKPRIACALATGIIILGLAPLTASTFLQSRGVYRVRVVLVGPDRMVVDDAEVTSSNGGEPKKVEGGWEFDIPPQTRPADGELKVFASEKSAFLSGSSVVVLDREYFPTVEIRLNRDTSATVRGDVIDERGRSVADAHVSISGYPDAAVTDEMGNFVLPAHAADGQMVQVRAQKGQLLGSMSVPAGRPVQLVVKRP
ncbi:MAG: hypothetical protein WA424_05575 [Candidatus Sulfotelmatobacter sp.]